MAEAKTKVNDASVEDFLNTIEDKQKRTDCFKITALMKKISGKKAKMWGTAIIGFGLYTIKYASGKEGDWPLIAFSPRKQNITIYIMPGFENYTEYMSKLGKYKTTGCCLYIKKLEDVDVNVLENLIQASYKQMEK